MTIGKFADLTGIKIHTLRYYEQELLITPARKQNGRRCYSESDLTWIQFIQRLKDTGMPIKKIREYAELRAIGDSTMTQRRDILKEHRVILMEEIKRLQVHLQKLDDKIEYYDSEIRSVRQIE